MKRLELASQLTACRGGDVLDGCARGRQEGAHGAKRFSRAAALEPLAKRYSSLSSEVPAARLRTRAANSL